MFPELGIALAFLVTILTLGGVTFATRAGRTRRKRVRIIKTSLADSSAA
jgi:hypothetical protein